VGNITMVEHTPFGQQDFDRYGQAMSSSRKKRYAFGRSAKDDESVPLFLSDPDGEPDPSEYDDDYEAPRSRMSLSLKILMAVVAAAGVAMMFAMATSDATRDVIVSAKASFSSMQPQPAEAAQPETTPSQPNPTLTASDAQVKDPARWSAPGAPQQSAAQPAAPQTAATTRGPVVAMAPSRDNIPSAYQSAPQSRAAPSAPVAPAAVAAPPVTAAPVATAPAVAAPPPARVMGADELALLMKRAKEMLSSGDIPVARLLLRRAADAQDPTAALLLAQTYDPAVLGTQDARNIIPDPEAARLWYQKAAQLGSADAQRRLAQMQ
jgi:hypothetical protein